MHFRFVNTYDRSCMKVWDPVRSPLIKHASGRLVVGSVTTSEHRLLHVFLPTVCRVVDLHSVI